MTASALRSIANDGNDGFVVSREDSEQDVRVVEFDVTDFQAPDNDSHRVDHNEEPPTRSGQWSALSVTSLAISVGRDSTVST